MAGAPPIQVINFRQAVPPGQQIVVTERAKYNGSITGVVIHFPTGANALVGVTFSVNGRQFLPDEGSIALDDTTVPFNVDILVRYEDRIDVSISNTDSVNAHTISVVATLQGAAGT